MYVRVHTIAFVMAHEPLTAVHAKHTRPKTVRRKLCMRVVGYVRVHIA